MAQNVLIVDDSAVTRAMIAKTLDLAQIPVADCLQAGNGKEALELLESHWVDLVLADLNMPVMGGRELLRVMRTTPEMADIPVIVISSEHCPPGSLALSWASGYVRKPFTPEALRAAIDGLAAKKRGSEVDAHWLLERFDYVLQTLTFMCADRLAEGEQAITPDRSVTASMEFSGSVNGSIWIAVSPGLARDMARNALGDDQLEVGDRQAADVVGEVLNVTCGLVTDALSHGAPTEMTPPALSELDAQGWDELLLQPIATTCLVEESPLLVALSYTAKRD